MGHQSGEARKVIIGPRHQSLRFECQGPNNGVNGGVFNA